MFERTAEVSENNWKIGEKTSLENNFSMISLNNWKSLEAFMVEFLAELEGE